ncbi:putative ATP-dependent RNA helicase spindle-E-like, partial [Tropilaelaps mercedesae]
MKQNDKSQENHEVSERILESRHLSDTYFKEENLRQRYDLPVAKHWTNILSSVDSKPVTIIIGSTGCGKTTQVPQLLLQENLCTRQEPCRIVVTQPRRIAAISVAQTVCAERAWKLGTICGYQ